MKTIYSIDNITDFKDYLIQHTPELYTISEDFQVFIKLIAQGYYLDYVIIKDFVDNINVDDCPERFLPYLGSLIGYEFRGDLNYEEQRVILKSLYWKYKNRGSIDSILRFCIYGGDLDKALIYKRDISDIEYVESKDLIFRYSQSKLSSNHKFNDFSKYRAGVYFLLFFNKIYDSTDLPTIQPAGTRSWLFNYLESDVIDTRIPESFTSIYDLTDSSILSTWNYPGNAPYINGIVAEVNIAIEDLSYNQNQLKFNFLSEFIMMGKNTFTNEDFLYNGLYLCDNLFTGQSPIPNYDTYREFLNVLEKVYSGDEVKSYFDIITKYLFGVDRLLDNGERIRPTFKGSFFSEVYEEQVHFDELNDRIYSFYRYLFNNNFVARPINNISPYTYQHNLYDSQFMDDDPFYYTALFTQDSFRFKAIYLPYHYDYNNPFIGILNSDYEFMEYICKYKGTDSDDDLYFRNRLENLSDSNKVKQDFINLYKKCFEIDFYNFCSHGKTGNVWNFIGGDLDNSGEYLFNSDAFQEFVINNFNPNFFNNDLYYNFINTFTTEVIES